MSTQDAKKFVDLVTSNPQLQEQVKGAQGNLAGLAAQQGLNVTQDEVHDELRARWGITGDSDGGDICGVDFSQCTCAPT